MECVNLTLLLNTGIVNHLGNMWDLFASSTSEVLQVLLRDLLRHLLVSILTNRWRPGLTLNFVVDCFYEVHGALLFFFNVSFGDARYLPHGRSHTPAISRSFPDKWRTSFGVRFDLSSSVWRLLINIEINLVQRQHRYRLLIWTHNIVNWISIVIDVLNGFLHFVFWLNRSRKSLGSNILVHRNLLRPCQNHTLFLDCFQLVILKCTTGSMDLVVAI